MHTFRSSSEKEKVRFRGSEIEAVLADFWHPSLADLSSIFIDFSSALLMDFSVIEVDFSAVEVDFLAELTELSAKLMSVDFSVNFDSLAAFSAEQHVDFVFVERFDISSTVTGIGLPNKQIECVDRKLPTGKNKLKFIKELIRRVNKTLGLSNTPY